MSGKGYKLSEEHKKNIGKSNSISLKGRKLSKETIKKISDSNRGKKMSIESRKKISESKKGEKNHFWKGGISEENDIIRHSFAYKQWRSSVFERDHYTCQICGEKKNLNADHIKRFSIYKNLRFDVNNGRTLCNPCHRKTDTWGKCLQEIESGTRLKLDFVKES